MTSLPFSNNQNCSFLKPSLFNIITILNTGVRCKYLCCDNGRIPFALGPFQVDECMNISRYMYDNEECITINLIDSNTGEQMECLGKQIN